MHKPRKRGGQRWGWKMAVGVLCASLLGAEAPRPRVTRVVVDKAAREMVLWSDAVVVARYAVAIGRGGPGPKRMEGDNVTPVGRYTVLRHLPSHLRIFLELDYPNADDRARFDELKRKGDISPGAKIGGDIGIHGAPPDRKPFVKSTYQSRGCVVVTNDEIDEIARLVPDGTSVEIVDASPRVTP